MCYIKFQYINTYIYIYIIYIYVCIFFYVFTQILICKFPIGRALHTQWHCLLGTQWVAPDEQQQVYRKLYEMADNVRWHWAHQRGTDVSYSTTMGAPTWAGSWLKNCQIVNCLKQVLNFCLREHMFGYSKWTVGDLADLNFTQRTLYKSILSYCKLPMSHAKFVKICTRNILAI